MSDESVATLMYVGVIVGLVAVMLLISMAIDAWKHGRLREFLDSLLGEYPESKLDNAQHQIDAELRKAEEKVRRLQEKQRWQ